MRTKTTKITTFATTFVLSCSLLYMIGGGSAYPRAYQAPVERSNFDIPAAAPVEFLALSRDFNTEMERISFTTPAAVPVELTAPSHEINAPIEPISPEAPTASPVMLPTPAVRRQADAHQANVEPPSPMPTTNFNLPRRLEGNVDRISLDAPSLAPMAFMRFCLKYVDDCKVSQMSFRASPVALTQARRAELVQVNREVNRAIRPQANLNGVMAEEWLVSPAEGDCNDYAVTKRHELLARGWPSRALLLAEVVVPSGEHHLILVVRTREDDLVLDNLNWNVRPVSQIRYQWVRVQQANNPKFWSTASVTRSTRVAMNTR